MVPMGVRRGGGGAAVLEAGGDSQSANGQNSAQFELFTSFRSHQRFGTRRKLKPYLTVLSDQNTKHNARSTNTHYTYVDPSRQAPSAKRQAPAKQASKQIYNIHHQHDTSRINRDNRVAVPTAPLPTTPTTPRNDTSRLPKVPTELSPVCVAMPKLTTVIHVHVQQATQVHSRH